jgi:hypothetical protein
MFIACEYLEQACLGKERTPRRGRLNGDLNTALGCLSLPLIIIMMIVIILTNITHLILARGI